MSGPNYAGIDRIIVFIAIGIILSVILRQLYRFLRTKSLSFLSLSLLAIPCSALGAMIWVLLFDKVLLPQLFNITVEIPWLDITKGFLNKSFVLLSWSLLYFGIKHWQDLQIQQAQLLQATTLVHQAQLQMLRYQLNPHFLFNVLNSIRAMVDEDALRAKEMVTELSDFLRYTLSKANVHELPLGEEIEAMRQYLKLEKIRYDDKLEVNIHIDPSIEGCKVPSFFLHPLVENAIKYGMQTSSFPLKVHLAAYPINGSLHIEIANTGTWINYDVHVDDPTNGTGIGLENIRRRLSQAFPNRHRFEIKESDGWVRAVIELPKESDIDDDREN